MLEQIRLPEDLRKLSVNELKVLATEVREQIIETTARTGGHVAPNLGVVELTLALHYVFNTPFDRIIWDVGHQCYAHKIITGRKDRFGTLRQYQGIAGFPKRSESEYDVFDTGHSGNSISVALGLTVADRLQNQQRRAIAVIGDGSIVTGMAFEALNHAGSLQENIIIILNDNEMSIARSTGAMASYLNRVITGRIYNRIKDDTWTLLGLLPRNLSEKAKKAARKLEEGLKNLIVPSIFFEELGFRYVGPINGHDFNELLSTFNRVKTLPGPILVHVVTRKGAGYEPALKNPELFHGIGPFDIKTGAPCVQCERTFTDYFGDKLTELAQKNPRIVAITAGMCLGTGLKRFREKFPSRFFDVGIAEQHAVTFAAGLALNGLKPVVAIYSTFLLRAVDQILQDVCLQRLPVIFAIDRAGLVGEDGPTHHGVYDLSYLLMIPDITVMAPRDGVDLERMLEFAVGYDCGPLAIRYPRAISPKEPIASNTRKPIAPGSGEILIEGSDGAVLALGSTVLPAVQAAHNLIGRGIKITVADARCAKPVDRELVKKLAGIRGRLITIEENTVYGGFGNAVSLVLEECGIKCQLRRLGIEDRFIEHGPRQILLEKNNLSVDRLTEIFQEFFK